MIQQVYLLHFSPPYKHAGHYVGYTTREDVEERLAEHIAGHGARLCRVAIEAGCEIPYATLLGIYEQRLRDRGHQLKGKVS